MNAEGCFYAKDNAVCHSMATNVACRAIIVEYKLRNWSKNNYPATLIVIYYLFPFIVLKAEAELLGKGFKYVRGRL